MRIVHNNWHETQPIWYLLKIVTRKRSESFNLEAITSDKVTRLENISDSYWQRRGLLATKEGREHRPLLFRSRKYLKATYRYNLIRMQNDTVVEMSHVLWFNKGLCHNERSITSAVSHNVNNLYLLERFLTYLFPSHICLISSYLSITSVLKIAGVDCVDLSGI